MVGVLKDVFPKLYSIARNKGALVADYLCWHGDSIVWDVYFV